MVRKNIKTGKQLIMENTRHSFDYLLIKIFLRSPRRWTYLIVLWDESTLYGGGTHGEITIAYWVDKPIFLVNKLPKEKLSGWISSCSTETFESFDELKKALLTEFQS